MFKRGIVWMVFLGITGCGGDNTTGGTTLVEVNGEAITQTRIDEELKTLPTQAQHAYQADAKGFV